MTPKAKVILAAGLLAPVIAGAAVLYFSNPTRVPIYPVCVFHAWTGLDCPGCGTLPRVARAVHGRINEALHFNLLLVLSLPLFTWWGYRMVSRKWHNQPPPPMRMGWCGCM